MNEMNDFIQLRVTVAFLGEKPAAGWWESAFLEETGLRYLAFAFPRTPVLSAIQGATDAARRIHDERIGKKGAIHLFRLPYEAELAVFERLRENERRQQARFVTAPKDKDEALARLRDLAQTPEKGHEGPVFIGSGNPITDSSITKRMAALYLGAFEDGKRVFPFLESPA
jgi:hypothetical protein